MNSYTAKAAFQKLREDVRKLERQPSGSGAGDMMAFDCPEIDVALPWGALPRGGLHEVAVPPESPSSMFASAAGFAAALLGRASAPFGMSVWCQNRRRAQKYGQIYGPGLAAYGLDPNRLLIVNAESDAETFWVMEECLKSAAIRAVLGEVGELDLTSSRRLQLAAEKFGCPALLLRPQEKAPGNNAALTRWHIRPGVTAPGSEKDDSGQTVGWRATLWRCRGGASGEWEILWKNEAFCCHMAGAMAD
ncbi:MAG: hypothetical protein K9G33_01900 [Sneathiella sp.]|nr:hypothetical protein [Sneathiella sp.]